MNRSPPDAGRAPCACGACAARNAAIDIHAHFFPEAYLDLIAREGGAHGAEFVDHHGTRALRVGTLFTGPLAPRFIDLDLRIEAMDRQGVEAQALSLTQPMVYWADDALSERLAVVYNDGLAEAALQHPGRLYGLAILPMQTPALAIREARRSATLPGIRGVYMATCVLDRELGDEAFWPVYEVLEDLGLPVFLHPLNVIGMTDRLRPYFLSNLLGNPFDNAIAAAHLMFSGVMDRFPRLEVVLPHGGGAFPFLLGRLAHGWSVRRECKHLAASPMEYARRFHYDTITHDPVALRFLIDRVGADRVLLGSDYCFDMGTEDPRGAVGALANLPAADRELILSGNACRLLGLRAPVTPDASA
ncbi:MAG: amidohydrolase family protein [Rhodobacteraceae bacterium]|jgi:aminocarboxymuconate-semialdehyde decarboxylase|nr:amidohydrolase family protein [Paracoccaceae bacterium]